MARLNKSCQYELMERLNESRRSDCKTHGVRMCVRLKFVSVTLLHPDEFSLHLPRPDCLFSSLTTEDARINREV